MRAQGWAEVEKAKAQRKPAAMREHEQIFGQAPRGIDSARDLSRSVRPRCVQACSASGEKSTPTTRPNCVRAEAVAPVPHPMSRINGAPLRRNPLTRVEDEFPAADEPLVVALVLVHAGVFGWIHGSAKIAQG